MSQYVSNVRFFNVFTIRQAKLRSIVPKQANFRRSLENRELKCADFLAFHCDKTMQYREPIFAISFLCQSSWIHNITVPLKNILFLNYKTSSILIFTFFADVPKTHKEKKIETKGQNWKQHYPNVIKSSETFAENYFNKFIFHKIGTFLCFLRSKHNSHLAKGCFQL